MHWYSSKSNLILGFHGCDKRDLDDLLTGRKSIKNSKEDYDWLGHGMYFWENDEARAWDWIKNKKEIKESIETAVIGAIIDLGYCLDLMNSSSIQYVKRFYDILKIKCESDNLELPMNANHPKSNSNDCVLRRLDCAVIELLHDSYKELGEKEFDSVRALFIEGDDIYPEAGFKEKTHIQICVRNPNCIKGFFLPRKNNNKCNSV